MLSVKEGTVIRGSCNEAILQTSLDLKKNLKSLDKVFSRLKLEFLLNRALFSVKTTPQRRDVLVNYGNCLVQYIGKDIFLNSELVHHLKYIFMKLQTEHDNASDELISNLWSKLEGVAVFQASANLNLSNKIIEGMVLQWIDNISTMVSTQDTMVLLSKTSAGSPELFQIITSILCEALMRMNGHQRVLEVINAFVQLVKCACIRGKRDFLNLYPRSCCQVVSLLVVSPEVHSKRRRNIVCEVVSLLFEIYLADKQKLFILLSHYSQWVSVFKAHLHKSAPGLINSI